MAPSSLRVSENASESTNRLYSSALKNSGLTWDAATLDKWLANPAGLVPGTRMAGFPGLSSETQRADVIAYLSTLTIKPER
jgi:cytochrome c